MEKKMSSSAEEIQNYCAEIGIKQSVWLEEREGSAYTVRYLFNTLSQKFANDPAYGAEWVKGNTEAIAILVNAVMLEVSAKISGKAK